MAENAGDGEDSIAHAEPGALPLRTSGLPPAHQLFKKLLTAFFGDLLNIVRPSLAGHTRLELTTFEDKELFTDLKQGEHRFADLVARFTLDDAASTLVLAHVEVEGDATAEMGEGCTPKTCSFSSVSGCRSCRW